MNMNELLGSSEKLLAAADMIENLRNGDDAYYTPEKMDAAVKSLRDLAALTREAHTEGVDVEAMLAACVPGGSSVDPQTVADNIREWFATPPAPQRQSSNPSGLSSESAALSSEQRMAQGEDSINVPSAKALIAAVAPGYRVIYRSAFRWMDDKGNALPNHYEMFGAASLAKDFGYDLVLDLGFAAILRDTTQPPHQDRGEEQPADTVGAMTPKRAIFFLERFKREEKLLGPHEQWALDFAIAALTEAKQQDDDGWEANFRYLLDRSPHTLRSREGGGPENLMQSAILTFTRMEHRLEAKQQGPGEAVAEVVSVRDGGSVLWTDKRIPVGTKLYTAPQVEAKRQTGEGNDPKASVLARYPNAYAYHWADRWVIYAARSGALQGIALGSGATQRAAWIAAAAKPSGEGQA